MTTTNVIQLSPFSPQSSVSTSFFSPPSPNTSSPFRVSLTPIYPSGKLAFNESHVDSLGSLGNMSSEPDLALSFRQHKVTELKEASIAIKQKNEKKLQNLETFYKPILWTTGCLAVALTVGVAVAALFFWVVAPLVLTLLSIGTVASIALGIFTIHYMLKFPVLKNAYQERVSLCELMHDTEGCADFVVEKITAADQNPIVADTNMDLYLKENFAAINQAVKEFVLLTKIEKLKHEILPQLEEHQKEINRIREKLCHIIISSPTKSKTKVVSQITIDAQNAKTDLSKDQKHLDDLKELLEQHHPTTYELQKKLLQDLKNQLLILEQFRELRTKIVCNFQLQRHYQNNL